MKDIEISEVLGISINTIQEWKKSNDYRYILYQYFSGQSKDKMENWLNNFESDHFITFVSEDQFYNKFCEQGCEILKLQPCSNIIEYSLDKRKDRSFKAQREDKYIFIAFRKRFPSLKNLEELLESLQIVPGEKSEIYDEIFFITNEKTCPPKYFDYKEDQQISETTAKVKQIKDSVKIQCLNIQSVGKTLYGKSVIFKDDAKKAKVK